MVNLIVVRASSSLSLFFHRIFSLILSTDCLSIRYLCSNTQDPAFVIPPIHANAPMLHADRDYPLLAFDVVVHDAAPLGSDDNAPTGNDVRGGDGGGESRSAASSDSAAGVTGTRVEAVRLLDAPLADDCVAAACDGGVVFDARWFKVSTDVLCWCVCVCVCVCVSHG